MKHSYNLLNEATVLMNCVPFFSIYPSLPILSAFASLLLLFAGCWWRAIRMTAGTVVITGGILATVILLLIIAVLCYCRLQVRSQLCSGSALFIVFLLSWMRGALEYCTLLIAAFCWSINLRSCLSIINNEKAIQIGELHLPRLHIMFFYVFFILLQSKRIQVFYLENGCQTMIEDFV